MRRISKFSYFFAFSAAAILGCGSASPKQQTGTVAIAFANAYRAHDGKRVCGLLDPHSEASSWAGACPSLVFTAIAFHPPPSPVVTNDAITGTHALVTLGGEGAQAQLELVKTASGWRVEGLSH